MATCSVRGCERLSVTRYGQLCTAHRSRKKRHGDALQEPITKRRLHPYGKIVKGVMKRNPSSPAWGHLEDRYAQLVENAQNTTRQYETGQPMNRYERKAAYEVVKVARETTTRDVMETVMSMVVMLEMEPQAFKSDTAFWVQVGIRFRCLTDTSFGEWWDHKNGRPVKLHRDTPQRVLVFLGKWLVEALGMGGVHVARAEREAQEKKLRERDQLHDALRSLS